MSKNMYNTHKKKDKNHVGTINMNELIINRSGKINAGSNPEIGTKVHKSKRNYDRNRERRKLRNQLKNYDF